MADFLHILALARGIMEAFLLCFKAEGLAAALVQ